jgi:hypothetical protein
MLGVTYKGDQPCFVDLEHLSIRQTIEQQGQQTTTFVSEHEVWNRAPDVSEPTYLCQTIPPSPVAGSFLWVHSVCTGRNDVPACDSNGTG